MNVEEIRRRKQAIEDRYGTWTAENIRLHDDLYTLVTPRKNEPGKPYTGHEGVDPRVRRFVRVVADLAGQPLEKLRILDLGPLEGSFSLEFALHGAEVLAIEGREANLEKIRFARDVFGLKNLELILDDVRNLDVDRHGLFDVVICSGILYHLDAPSQVPFLQRVAEVCQRFALIESHLSLVDQDSFVCEGRTYWGRMIQEHEPGSTPEERIAQPWFSLDNAVSFSLTRPSLYNLLRHVGFTSVYECHNPMAYVQADRNLFLAFKGQSQTIRINPLLNEPEEDWTEHMEWSEPPTCNEDFFANHEVLVTKYQALRSQYEALHQELRSFTYLSGALRKLPRLIRDAFQRRWPWGTSSASQQATPRPVRSGIND